MSQSATAWKRRPPIEEMLPGQTRQCIWPGCLDWYDAWTGPHEPGWIRAEGLVCPTHAATGHMPTKRILMLGLRLNVAVPTCPCGWEGMPRQTLGEMIEEWQGHATGYAVAGVGPQTLGGVNDGR